MFFSEEIENIINYRFQRFNNRICSLDKLYRHKRVFKRTIQDIMKQADKTTYEAFKADTISLKKAIF